MANDDTNQLTTPETDAAATAQTEPAKAASVEAVGAKEGQGSTPTTATTTPKTYTEEDFNKAIEAAKATTKGGYEGTLKQVQEQLKQEKLARQQVQANLDEAANQNFLKQIGEAGLDTNLAQTIVTREKASRMEAARLAEERERINAIQAELNLAARGKALTDVAKEFGLDEKEAQTLAAAQNRSEMVAKAATLALAKAKAAAVKSDVPAGDGGTGAGGPEFSKLPPMEQLKAVLEHKVK